MSLPSGYKRLEYIESSGTQYIDTGFVPNQNTRVVMDCDFHNTSSTVWLFGARVSTSKNFSMLFVNSKIRTDYCIANEFYVGPTSATHIDKNKNVTTVNGETVTDAYTPTSNPFSPGCPMFLFSANDNGTAKSCSSGSIKNCKIYDNGSQVRDYIPVQRVDGTVGLLDQVNFVFYPDAAGVGFVAGPVIPDVPVAAPGNFRQTSQDYFEIGLAWDASEGATGYNLYKDGALIYTGTDLSYLDTQGYPSTSYIYQVTAFSAEGEGDPATLEASTKAGWAVIEPVFLSASIGPNPVGINQSILISVQLTDAVRILEAETFYSGELYAGEV